MGGGDSSGPLHDSASPPAITVDRVSPLLKTCCLVMSRSVAPCYKCLNVKRQKQCHQVNATAGTTFSYARSYCGMVAVSVRCWQQVSYPIAPGRACVHPSAGTLHTCAYSTGLIGKSSPFAGSHCVFWQRYTWDKDFTSPAMRSMFLMFLPVSWESRCSCCALFSGKYVDLL